MKDSLKKLLERREVAYKEYEEFVSPIVTEGRALTAEEETKRSELRTKFEAFDSRIDEVRSERIRKSELEKARADLGDVTDVNVKSEPTVYGEGSPNSYFADLIRAQSPMWKDHFGAVQRLWRGSHEADVELVRGKGKAQKRLETLIREENRNNHATARQAITEARERGRAGLTELRAPGAMTTTEGSGGSFVTPIFFVEQYAPWREAGRAFATQVNKQGLPEYGMEVFLPAVTSAATVGQQGHVSNNADQPVTEAYIPATSSDENTTFDTGSGELTAGYLSAGLQTLAGQMVVSQQLLDRAGPSFQFDKLVFDQLQRDYAPKLDKYVLSTALAHAQSVTYAGTGDDHTFQLVSATGVGGFFATVSSAKAKIRTTAGVFMDPTHIFLQPDRWEYIAAWSDKNGRPVVVPDYAGPFNALAAGSADGDAGVEGSTGYRFNGLRSFTDFNIPTNATATKDQVIVGVLNEVWLFEGEQVPRVIPQTYAQNLSVLLQLYAYSGVIVRYPKAIVTIKGDGLGAITF